MSRRFCRQVAPLWRLAVVASTVLAQRTQAQAPGYRLRLDSLFAILDTNQRTMGSVTIRKAGRVIYARSIGYRDSSAMGWVRSDSATTYRIGSITKPFTAVS
jgi:CubicO group peptidase (beta-lactamase class C family)